MLVHVARYSLSLPMIKDEIEHETVDNSIITSSKPYEFSCANCTYVVAPYFFPSSTIVKFFTMVHQVTLSVSSFSECLELFSDFSHICVGPNDVIPLAVFDVRPSRKLIYHFVLSLGVLPSEFVALYLPKMHDKTHKQITICDNNYKFAGYPFNSLHEFTVKNMVMVTIYSERFSLETASRSHA